MPIVYLGFGSNVGDRAGYIRRALSALADRGIYLIKCSTLHETEPVGGPPQGRYLNAVAKVETDLDPEVLLKIINAVEEDLGRTRTVKNGPRTIDIDILLYDQIRLATANLTIPHPRMHLRDFVLNPLEEIEPDITREICR